jgi:CheY-like chemotaxis protein
MSKRLQQGLCILMADDCQEDVFFVQRALEKSQLQHLFYSVPDGSEAIAYLKAEGQYSDRQKFPFPNVLLCDLKMPVMDGFAVLQWLQSHPHCKVIPTIILSSSSLERDVHQSYVLGANAYLEKPHSLEDLTKIMQHLYSFWVACEVPLPPPGEHCSSDPH